MSVSALFSTAMINAPIKVPNTVPIPPTKLVPADAATH